MGSGKAEASESETHHKLNRWKRLCRLSEVAIKLDSLSGWYYCPALGFIQVCGALLEWLVLKFTRLSGSRHSTLYVQFVMRQHVILEIKAMFEARWCNFFKNCPFKDVFPHTWYVSIMWLK